MIANAERSERLAVDRKRLVADFERLLEKSTGAGSGWARPLRERLTDTMKTAKANYARLQLKAKDGARATHKVIHAHPYRAVGVALGVGVLIGWLARRK
jgi:ElaB/YqjD/DUF883 family membrane-anchored ribosome-binding protein